MAITFVNEHNQEIIAQDMGNDPTTVSLPTTLEDDIWILAISWDTATIANGSTFYTDQGYTIIAYSTGDDPDYGLFYKIMGATPDTTVNIEHSNSASGTGNLIMQAWRGVDGTTPLDGVTPALSGSNLNPPSVTTNTDGALVIAYGALDDDSATLTTSPAGYTNILFQATGTGTSGDTSAALGSKIVATAGAEDPATWVFSTSDQALAYTFVLKPAAGGAAATPHNAFGLAFYGPFGGPI